MQTAASQIKRKAKRWDRKNPREGSWPADSTPRAARLVLSVHDLEMSFQDLTVLREALSGGARRNEACCGKQFRRQLSCQRPADFNAEERRRDPRNRREVRRQPGHRH